MRRSIKVKGVNLAKPFSNSLSNSDDCARRARMLVTRSSNDSRHARTRVVACEPQQSASHEYADGLVAEASAKYYDSSRFQIGFNRRAIAIVGPVAQQKIPRFTSHGVLQHQWTGPTPPDQIPLILGQIRRHRIGQSVRTPLLIPRR